VIKMKKEEKRGVPSFKRLVQKGENGIYSLQFSV